MSFIMYKLLIPLLFLLSSCHIHKYVVVYDVERVSEVYSKYYVVTLDKCDCFTHFTGVSDVFKERDTVKIDKSIQYNWSCY